MGVPINNYSNNILEPTTHKIMNLFHYPGYAVPIKRGSWHQIITLILLLISITSVGQTSKRKYPMPGDTITDHKFTDLVNFPRPSVKISDFRGKWLILDFWSRYCKSCIASFPKMNIISEDFKDREVQIIMVGSLRGGGETEGIIKKLYQRLEGMYNLKFTVAYDSTLFEKCDIGSLPHILVVNPEGIIKAKTNHIDSLQIALLLKGEIPTFERVFSDTELKGGDIYDNKVPLLTNNGLAANGGRDIDYIYRSLLVPHDKSLMPYYNTVNLVRKFRNNDLTKPIKMDIFDMAIYRLYHLAYFGRSDWGELDTTMYGKYSNQILDESGNNIKTTLNKRFAYSLTMPATDSIPNKVMYALQEDLRRTFPYHAKVELKMMPVYVVKVADQAKLDKLLKDKTTGPASRSNAVLNGIWKIRNISFNDFMRSTIGLMDPNLTIINEISMPDKFIDVDFHSDMLTTKSIINALEKCGFKVEETERLMKVIILSK